jgi:hypothetical protein
MSAQVLSINATAASHDNSFSKNSATHIQRGTTWKIMNIMNKIMQSATAVVMVGSVTGCETTGLSPREHSGLDYPGYILNLQTDRTNAPPQKPVLPIHLAIAQIGETAPPQTMLDDLEVKPELIVSAVGLPLPADSGNYFGYKQAGQATGDYATRVKAVCNLASAAGANCVFLIGGTVDSWTRENSLGMFDLALVGGWIIPGTKISIEGKGAGTLIEAATGQPVFCVNAEYKESALSPDYLSGGKTMDMRVQAQDEFVKTLSNMLLKKLAGGASSGSVKLANQTCGQKMKAVAIETFCLTKPVGRTGLIFDFLGQRKIALRHQNEKDCVSHAKQRGKSNVRKTTRRPVVKRRSRVRQFVKRADEDQICVLPQIAARNQEIGDANHQHKYTEQCDIAAERRQFFADAQRGESPCRKEGERDTEENVINAGDGKEAPIVLFSGGFHAINLL